MQQLSLIFNIIPNYCNQRFLLMTLNPIHKYTNFMHKCVLSLELELQLSMVNLEGRVQSCRGLRGLKLMIRTNGTIIH